MKIRVDHCHAMND